MVSGAGIRNHAAFIWSVADKPTELACSPVQRRRRAKSSFERLIPLGLTIRT
jgi:hypothetical protein